MEYTQHLADVRARQESFTVVKPPFVTPSTKEA